MTEDLRKKLKAEKDKTCDNCGKKYSIFDGWSWTCVWLKEKSYDIDLCEKCKKLDLNIYEIAIEKSKTQHHNAEEIECEKCGNTFITTIHPYYFEPEQKICDICHQEEIEEEVEKGF